MNKKILSLLVLIAMLFGNFSNIFFNSAIAATSSYTHLREVDKGSFNEYRYKITKNFFKLKETFEVDFVIDSNVASQILVDAAEAFKYLPDDLNNDLKYNKLRIALKKAIKYPNNEVYFSGIQKALKGFIEEPKISSISGVITATPSEGNAPLVTTLRANVEDPTGTKISKSSYTWWMNVNGKREVIGNRISLSKTFINEGNYTVFLDVKSSHKNSKGYRDVLPFTSSVKIKVKEKIASVILRISGKTLNSDNEIKFSPETAGYGLIFDATSSVPTTGTKFVKTSWDFGNGVKKSYNGGPRIERVIFSREGNYDSYLELKTNTGKTIKKKFKILVHKPIASIKVNSTEGFMGDKFSFRAENHGGNNLTYSWEIIDTNKDKTVTKKTGNLFTYSFKDKGKYSVKLKIKDLAGNLGTDTKTIYVNSRAPVASFKSSIPYSNKPNQIFLDATSSYDLDYGDDGNLKYSWTIDGQKVNLEGSNDNGSTGFYTFSTIGEHSLVLEVEDPDDMISIKRSSVNINSILSLDFSIYPRVAQRDTTIRFIGDSPEAQFYTWDFGDGTVKSKAASKITHKYLKSGIFSVKLTVMGEGNKSNTYSKNVYIGDSKNPLSVIDINRGGGFDFVKENNACSGKTAYIVNRKDNIIFSGKDSIDTNGKNTGLGYSWKIGQGKYKKGPSINHKFDELGCYNVKLTVKSDRDSTTDGTDIWVKVKNIKPTISSLKISPVNLNTDPVVVNVSAIGTKDLDGVIQSYIWYYTTDIDSEAQDFRITKNANTTFVIPKIQGTYYFGVAMKDNNGAKVNSEDLVNKIGNNFVELQGDNSNTPLIDFSTSDSSVAIGDEISFRAIAKNIRGDSIEKTSEFFWDFDGDGFYEKETKGANVTYKYTKSGTFYPKVKVRNKGFSNTRTLTINVSNKLVADFKYISIGNKNIFVDKSKGTIDKNTWDLGDGTKMDDKNKFIHTYNDKKSVHSVELLVAEGTKTKKVSKEVEKNLRNVISSRKKGLNVFSFPSTNSSGSIILEEEESVFMYLGESKGSFTNYGIDYDIDKDSDLNGGKDNDIDNFKNSSYKDGSPDEILLNNKRKQTIRLFLIDENNSTVDSKDIQIIKEYIDEIKEVKAGDLVFTGVSDSIKVKIENLKIMITKLPQEDRMKGMLYLQKMQENWSDETEKVRTIIEFEGFLESTGNEKAGEIMDLLEELLVDGEDDNGERTIAFVALKALIPDDIQCSVETGTCKESLVRKLEQIKNSSDIELNKKLGTELGNDAIVSTKLMTAKQKNDFKGILRQLIYGTNIPKEEIIDQGLIDKETQPEEGTLIEENEESGKLVTFLKKAGWWIAGIVGVIILLMFVFWILDFLKNRKSGESFENFVDNKTDTEDILGDLSDPLEEKKEETKVDPLAEPEKKQSAVFSAESQVKNVVNEKSIQEDNLGFSLDVDDKKEVKKEENIPDWLSGSVESETKKPETKKTEIVEPEKKVIEKREEIKKEELKSEEIKSETPEKKIPKKVVLSEEKPVKIEEDELDFDLEEETKLEDNTPDWLKNSMTDKLPKKEEIKKENFIDNKTENNKIEEKEPEPVIVEDKKEEKIDLDNDVPDWLKDVDLEEKVEEKKEENKVEENKLESKDETKLNDDEVPDWLKNTGLEEKEKEEKKIEKIDEVKLNDDDIPDWLKGSLDEKSSNDSTKEEEKENKKEEKKIEKKVDDEKKSNINDENKLDAEDIPDWLKDSLKEESPKKEEKKNKVEKEKKSTKIEEKKTVEKTEKKDENKKDELWDDGMTIPDWLKND